MPKVADGVSGVLNDLIISNIFGPYLNRMHRLILLVSRLAAEALEADAGSVWLLKKGSLYRAVIINRPADLLDSFVVDVREGLAGEVVRNCAPVASADVQRDPRTTRPQFAIREGLQTYAGCPIMVGSTCIGVMCFFRKTNRPFSKGDIGRLSAFTDLVGLAMHHCSTSLASFAQWQRCIQGLFEHSRSDSEGLAQTASPKRLHPIWVLGSSLPKGINQVTLARIQQYLICASVPATATQVAKATPVSAASARRYLNYLHALGIVERDVSYSNVGRPSYSYFLAGTSPEGAVVQLANQEGHGAPHV